MIKQQYEISSSNGVIYATPATADWKLRVMENDQVDECQALQGFIWSADNRTAH